MKAHGGTVVCSLRLRHLALVDAVGGRHRRVLRARRRQGGRPRHLDPVRLRRHDDAGAGGQAEGVQRLLRRARRQLELRPGHRRSSRRASSPRCSSSRPGYEPSVIGSTAWSAVQGGYFETELPPLPAAERRDRSRCRRRSRSTSTSRSSEFPNFSQYESWLGADLMIKGIQLAGKQPDTGRRHPRPAQPEELQRQRAAARDHRLLDRLRPRPRRSRAGGT